MRNKLIGIWRIIFSEHYLLITGGGSLLASYPKNMKHLELIKSIAEQVEANNEGAK